MHVVSYVHLLVLLYRTWTVKNFFWKFEKSLYCFEILFNQTLIKSLGGTKILSSNEVFNSLSLCFVYLVLFYKPFQTFIYIYIYIHAPVIVLISIHVYMFCPVVVVFNFYKLCLIHLSLFFFVTIKYNMFRLLCLIIIYGIHQHHRKLFCWI